MPVSVKDACGAAVKQASKHVFKQHKTAFVLCRCLESALIAWHSACVLQCIRADRDASTAHASGLSQQLEEARTALQQRGQEVEALTQLSLKGESTLRDYVAHLQVHCVPCLCCALKHLKNSASNSGMTVYLLHHKPSLQAEPSRGMQQPSFCRSGATVLQEFLSRQSNGLAH